MGDANGYSNQKTKVLSNLGNAELVQHVSSQEALAALFGVSWTLRLSRRRGRLRRDGFNNQSRPLCVPQ